MSHVIYFLGEELSNVEYAMQQIVPKYRPRLKPQDIKLKELSQILYEIRAGAKIIPPEQSFDLRKFDFDRLGSRRNIDEVTRVMQKAFLPGKYTAEQVVNVFTYLAQKASPAHIAGDLIKAVLFKHFKLEFSGEAFPVLLKIDPETQKFTSIKKLSPWIEHLPENSLTDTHITIQPDTRTYRDTKTHRSYQVHGFSQVYAAQYRVLETPELTEPLQSHSEFEYKDPAFEIIVKVFMPLAVGAVPRLEEVLISIRDHFIPVLKHRIDSIKDTLHLAIFEPSLLASDVKWTFPAAVSFTPVSASALSALRGYNNCDISLAGLTSEQIDQAYGALANDIRKLDAQKLENIGPTRVILNLSRRNEADDNWSLRGNLLKILRDRVFRGYEDRQLLNLCIAIGETKFNYLKTMVRKIQELFADKGCRLMNYDESRPLYTIAPREDRNSFDYCYRADWTEIILGSRRINRETYGGLLDRPLLTISIKIVYPLITGELIQPTAISFTSYVFELDDCIRNVVDLIQKGELKKRCFDEMAVYNDPRQAIQRAEQRANMAAAASLAGDTRLNADPTVDSPTRRARTEGISSPAPTRLTPEPFPSPRVPSPGGHSPDISLALMSLSSPLAGAPGTPVIAYRRVRRGPLPLDNK